MQERDKNVHKISMENYQEFSPVYLESIPFCNSDRSPSQFFMETEKRVMNLMGNELTISVPYPVPDVPSTNETPTEASAK